MFQYPNKWCSPRHQWLEGKKPNESFGGRTVKPSQLLFLCKWVETASGSVSFLLVSVIWTEATCGHRPFLTQVFLYGTARWFHSVVKYQQPDYTAQSQGIHSNITILTGPWNSGLGALIKTVNTWLCQWAGRSFSSPTVRQNTFVSGY